MAWHGTIQVASAQLDKSDGNTYSQKGWTSDCNTARQRGGFWSGILSNSPPTILYIVNVPPSVLPNALNLVQSKMPMLSPFPAAWPSTRVYIVMLHRDAALLVLRSQLKQLRLPTSSSAARSCSLRSFLAISSPSCSHTP